MCGGAILADLSYFICTFGCRGFEGHNGTLSSSLFPMYSHGNDLLPCSVVLGSKVNRICTAYTTAGLVLCTRLTSALWSLALLVDRSVCLRLHVVQIRMQLLCNIRLELTHVFGERARHESTAHTTIQPHNLLQRTTFL